MRKAQEEEVTQVAQLPNQSPLKESDLDDETYDDEEDSVVYSAGGRVFDQPQKGVYGIKPVKDAF